MRINVWDVSKHVADYQSFTYGNVVYLSSWSLGIGIDNIECN